MASATPTEQLWFRGLSARDVNPACLGIVAADPCARSKPRDQVLGQKTQFISVSKSGAAGVYYATSRGQLPGRVAVIDPSSLPPSTDICDLSSPAGAIRHGLTIGTPEFNFATQHHEVLVRGQIPPEALKAVVDSAPPPHGVSGGTSLRGFVTSLPKVYSDWIVESLCFTAQCFVSDDSDCYHLTKDCGCLTGEAWIMTNIPGNMQVCGLCMLRGIEVDSGRPGPSATQSSTHMVAASAPSRAWYATKRNLALQTGKFHSSCECVGLAKAKAIVQLAAQPHGLRPCSLCI